MGTWEKKGKSKRGKKKKVKSERKAPVSFLTGEEKKPETRPVVTTLETAHLSVILSKCRGKTESKGGCHPPPAACARSHTLSFSSCCAGAEAEGHTGFRCRHTLGLPQAHPHHSHQQGLPPRCPTPLRARALSGGEASSAARQMGYW